MKVLDFLVTAFLGAIQAIVGFFLVVVVMAFIFWPLTALVAVLVFLAVRQ